MRLYRSRRSSSEPRARTGTGDEIEVQQELEPAMGSTARGPTDRPHLGHGAVQRRRALGELREVREQRRRAGAEHRSRRRPRRSARPDEHGAGPAPRPGAPGRRSSRRRPPASGQAAAVALGDHERDRLRAVEREAHRGREPHCAPRRWRTSGSASSRRGPPPGRGRSSGSPAPMPGERRAPRRLRQRGRPSPARCARRAAARRPRGPRATRRRAGREHDHREAQRPRRPGAGAGRRRR